MASVCNFRHGISTIFNKRAYSIACRRSLSTSSSNLPDLEYIQQHYVIHQINNVENRSKEYLLLPPHKTVEDSKLDSSIKVASLFRHRDILFAARSFHQEYSLNDVCLPLVDVAMKEAGENGDQPQAIATLTGLSQWVTICLQDKDKSEELDKLQREDSLSFEAVQAIATGIPRKGHSVVGIGTYGDGELGWKALAREFIERKLSEEVNLYSNRGGRVVEIEHMADQNPGYLKSAGGAMARLFFL